MAVITNDGNPGLCACEDSQHHFDEPGGKCSRGSSRTKTDVDDDVWRLCAECDDSAHMPDVFGPSGGLSQ